MRTNGSRQRILQRGPEVHAARLESQRSCLVHRCHLWTADLGTERPLHLHHRLRLGSLAQSFLRLPPLRELAL